MTTIFDKMARAVWGDKARVETNDQPAHVLIEDEPAPDYDAMADAAIERFKHGRGS